MNFPNEYALLFAVALPVVVIVGIQVCLFLAGERETLLLPGFNRYPSYSPTAKAAEMAEQPIPVAAMAESSNDEMERLAA